MKIVLCEWRVGEKMNNGRKIAEGGVLLAVYVLLLFITVQIPFLGMITFFFLPIPFILVMLKENNSWLFGFLVVASVLSVIFGTVFSVPLTLFAGAVGIVIGYHLKNDKPVIQMFISTTLTVIACLIIFYSVTIFVAHMNIIEETMTMFEESMNESINTLNALGQPVPGNFEQTIRESMKMVRILLPSTLVISSMVLSYFMILAAQPFVKRFSNKTMKWPLFRNLRLPKSLLWYYIFVLIATLFIQVDEGSYFSMAVTNILYILQLFLVLQGVSFIFYVSHVKGWVKAIPIVLVVISLLNPLLLTLVRILGIIDVSLPFREAISKQK